METIGQNAEAKTDRAANIDWALLGFWIIYFGLIAGFAITVF